MFLSEGCSLRGQVIFPKTKSEENSTNEDEFILQLLTDLGQIFQEPLFFFTFFLVVTNDCIK